MEARESAAGGGGRQQCPNKDGAKEKTPLQRKWVSEPSATAKRSTFADPAARHRESLLCVANVGSAPQHNYTITGNSGKMLSGPSAVGAIGGPPPSQDPLGPFAQGFPGGYSYQLGQPYPQHPQTERFHSGAKPQPGLEAHAWPFAGQLPSDELYPVGHPGHTHPHGAGAGVGRFPRQKSPSLPSSFGSYSQMGPDPGDEGYGKKEQKPKKPGKYICYYCGRACAKPSVLKKHIRSHTGERPYPCVPCGFSFKTKSNLYKHRKSHAHAIKAGLVPFSDLAVSRGGDMEHASLGGEADVQSDGEQSTDTDEEGVEGATILTDKDGSITHISFEADKSPGGAEPAYADSAEDLPTGSIKVPILIVPKSRGIECPPFQDIKGSHHMMTSLAGRKGRSLDDTASVKPRLALRLNDKKGLDSDCAATQSLNLLSPHSKGSTDSGYFSRSESAEQQISPPNTNVKTYEEIMFGRTWYYRPNSRSRQFVTVAKISKDHICLRGDVGMSRDPKLYPTGPSQSSTGLLEPPSDSGPLIRSNSMPTSSPPNLSVPPGIRGSHSFDEMMTSDDVFYQPGLRRLQRQAAIELLAHEAHTGDTEGSVHMHKNFTSSLGKKLSERSPGAAESINISSYGTKVSMSEIATRKRRKEKSVGDEEDSPDHCDSTCSGSIDMAGDYVSFEGSRGTPTGKGSLQSAHSQSDSFDTCPSMCSEDIALFTDSECRKAAGNVISVIQHTNSLSRPNSFEKAESFEQSGYHPSAPSSQYSEQSDSDIFEDALSPESALLRTESMDQQLQSDSDLASLSSSSAAASPGQPYHIPHKLVRQPNIQVPEIRVTDEKDTEAPMAKEVEKQPPHAEEFQLPQRSDTLSQMPSEKLPPKKKRLRLADMEHSSGESSFESTCTSLSHSPSQESNLSHSSSFSMSFDRDEGLKTVSPTKQEDPASGGGTRPSEFLTVPGSGHSSHQQQREMRRSSSEQAPYTLPSEVTEMRSKSFDYGSLSSSRQGELYASASAMKERRRGFLVRQASLSVYPEAVAQEPGGSEMSIKQESVEQGVWLGLTGPPNRTSNVVSRTQRVGKTVGIVGAHQQHVLQQSISEDSLQDEPHYGRTLQHRLQTQGSSSQGEHPGHEVLNREVGQQDPIAPPFLSYQQSALFWSQEVSQASRQRLTHQAHQQLQKLQILSPNSLSGHTALHKQLIQDQPPRDGKSDTSSTLMNPAVFQEQNLAPLSSKPTSSITAVQLQQIQPIFATQNLGSHTSLPMMVPVRIQTPVPSYSSVMYTSVSQLVAHSQRSGLVGQSRANINNMSSPDGTVRGGIPSGERFNLSHFLGQTDGTLLRSPHWKSSACGPNTGIPLSLTSGTISTTDASGSGIGGSKRMLSPVSSLEFFIETKQQKMVKEERMFGQMVKEMSAVELSGTNGNIKLEEGPCSDDCERMSSSPPLGDFPAPNKSAIPVRSSAHHWPDVPQPESFTPPLQIVTDSSTVLCGRDSPEELDLDESHSSPQSMISSNDADEATKQLTASQVPENVLVQLAAHQGPGLSRALGQTLLLADVSDAQHFFQFPSLCTNSRVSWCFLNYTKPNSTQADPRSSIYSSWCISSYNPNPLNLSTKAALALLSSKQRKNTNLLYATAAMGPPSSGKLVSSVSWKLRFDQLKPEVMAVDISHFGRKMKDVALWEHPKEEHVEKDVSIKPATTEPTRIKIFEGGYKSNEDYVYVRGRGRGKYICEECGIRCKKPSMLKKHIRTHTDVRPYVCKFCNFAFKTKGNLTKHMKSKAHLKKCLELGVSTSSVDDAEADDADLGEEAGARRKALADHQFSDADDSEEDGDEVDDEDDEDDDYDGDSTPRTSSRSASPCGVPVTAAASQPSPPLFSYFTTVPSIRITAQATPGERAPLEPGHLPALPSMDEDLSQDFPLPSSRLSSPGPDYSGCPSPVSPSLSPSTRQYLSPHRDHSPRGPSPRQDASPLRHLSPKRDVGLCRRELSPRRGHLSLLAPLSRPTSPGKRDLSPRGRHKGMIRPNSPRRGLHQHLLLQSPQGGSRGLRSVHLAGLLSRAEFGPRGRRRTASAEMGTECVPGSPGRREQGGNHGNHSGPPHQVLFSHLPLHSQLQVRSPFPMIPIGGIQMVHAVPASLSTPLSQQGGQQAAPRLPPHKTPSEDHEASAHFGRGPGGRTPSGSEVVGIREQEENIQTCTKAIASLRIDLEEDVERRREGLDGEGGPHSEGQCRRSPPVAASPPSPAPPGPQHFSASPRSPSPASSPSPRSTPADASQSTKTSKDVS
ncbi:transcription factor HIVEP2a [Phyllopteryx taeniolatus]|uniref:transcription factor HIVEP2a n=1 Tax=Phyllopteryx taeniolatus TaxID=161469 RepID=UPI002AD2E391|nr:transcription factor HIVEP2a [Phyllopteryx taeniolatus]XP_061610926.1 transcription factor HIVEP2a [Phyllopteryx taeniolatus]XP_061610927.1 transcription factor HIVEP2a [Phyllopteryx taeniolatus]XP_061610928.1 transcription factor HIVEP2a [Phyllopteryx taeniolatus]XP_061610929.1 transcription factor HIVEP2a [Phyllopteryx taeniolatus]XP_061610931.1 transcription factor HIVEP2a [Phyllopteryx taeniolatus]XP_061610932.1 transcription factor HIVEP2a [Phyllopteryx taeniolatus]